MHSSLYQIVGSCISLLFNVSISHSTISGFNAFLDRSTVLIICSAIIRFSKRAWIALCCTSDILIILCGWFDHSKLVPYGCCGNWWWLLNVLSFLLMLYKTFPVNKKLIKIIITQIIILISILPILTLHNN